MAERDLRATPHRSRAREWALVLVAEGIEARIADDEGDYRVRVAEADAPRGEALLAAYEREHAQPPRAAVGARDFAGLGPLNAALAVVLALLAFYALTGPRDAERVWFARGSADAARIVSGELWRCVTALTLHADAVHVAGNAVFGALFLTAAGRALGPGLAFALTLLAGAGGNLANAFLRDAAHVSVGASTALFAAVGVLAGWRVPQLARAGRTGWRAAAPLAAGLGLLAMLGAGSPPTDLWAHAFGLAVGAPLGAAAGRLLRQPPAWPAQTGFALAGVAALGYCWGRALS